MNRRELRRHLIVPILLTIAMIGGCRSTRTGVEKGQVYFEQAQVYLEQGLDDDALEQFGLALAENPRLTEAHVGIGNIYRQRGDLVGATGAFEQATRIDPNSFDAHYFLALTHQLRGLFTQAIRTYLRALAINPGSFEANQNLATAYLQQSPPRATEALPYARRATQLKPDEQQAWANLAAVYSLLGQYADAVTAYREAVELGDMPEPVLLGLADAHLKLGNYEQGIIVLQTLLRRAPSSTAYERLGYAQFKMLQYDRALASFRAALSFDAEDTAALNGVGVCLMTIYIQGDRAIPAQRDEALRVWRRSIQIRRNQSKIVDLLSRYQNM